MLSPRVLSHKYLYLENYLNLKEPSLLSCYHWYVCTGDILVRIRFGTIHGSDCIENLETYPMRVRGEYSILLIHLIVFLIYDIYSLIYSTIIY